MKYNRIKGTLRVTDFMGWLGAWEMGEEDEVGRRRKWGERQLELWYYVFEMWYRNLVDWKVPKICEGNPNVVSK